MLCMRKRKSLTVSCFKFTDSDLTGLEEDVDFFLVVLDAESSDDDLSLLSFALSISVISVSNSSIFLLVFLFSCILLINAS